MTLRPWAGRCLEAAWWWWRVAGGRREEGVEAESGTVSRGRGAASLAEPRGGERRRGGGGVRVGDPAGESDRPERGEAWRRGRRNCSRLYSSIYYSSVSHCCSTQSQDTSLQKIPLQITPQNIPLQISQFTLTAENENENEK